MRVIPRVIRRLLPLSLVILLVGACGADGSSPSGGDRVNVVAAFYPLADAARRVGGANVDVVNLTPPGVEPHDLELTADDLEAIAGADVILYLGSGFQPAIEDAVTNEATGVALDALAGQELLAAPADDHGDEEGKGADEHEGEQGVIGDPHVWLDPMRFAVVSAAIGDTLADADPANAEGYHARASSFSDELAELDEEFRAGLAVCDGRVLFVNHAAFGYLATAYDLEQEAISGISPGAEPDPARLAELREEAMADGVTTVFTESLVSPDVAETLAAEVGVATAVLNPLEGLTPEQDAAGDDYLSVMRENLETLRDGLSCA